MTKHITIKDIAREAGVSIALVSFVMNNRIGADGKQKYRVSEDTKKRILEVANRLNYRPSSAARMLRKGRTRDIGVILSDTANIFYGIIARELENWAFQHGYTMLFGSSDEDPEKFSKLVQSFLNKDVEGFIVVPCVGSGPCVKQLMESGRPLVVIDRHHPDFDVPSVLTDNIDATEQAVKALKEQGVNKIAFVSYAMRISSMTDREETFRRIMGEDAIIWKMPFDRVDEEAERLADKIIQMGIDGLITASNVPSVALIKALFNRGVRIQQDVKLVSFDYSNVFDVFSPPIPHVQQPLAAISSTAAEYLVKLIEAKAAGEDISGHKDKIILKASLR